jgi:hypothetical protein
MWPAKIQPIEDWAAPRSVKNVLQFLGFENLYRRFIEGLSKVAKPLTELTAFNWAEAARSASATLKHLFYRGANSGAFPPRKAETDASDFALGAVLSQIQETKRLHPVAYHSRKFKPAEENYDVHDKKAACHRDGV